MVADGLSCLHSKGMDDNDFDEDLLRHYDEHVKTTAEDAKESDNNRLREDLLLTTRSKDVLSVLRAVDSRQYFRRTEQCRRTRRTNKTNKSEWE